MKRIAVASLLACFTLCAQVAHQHHPPRSAEEYAKVLDTPERDAWQRPNEVIQALKLKHEETIADIGAGTGYFALRFASRAGRVLAVDIDENLLKMLLRDAPTNVTAILAAPDDPKLPSSGVDTVFFCNVVHHIEDRRAYYQKLRKALKPGGRVVVLDFEKKELPVGPPVSMKLSREEMVKEWEAAGFRLARSHDFLPYQYFLEFEP